jgi:hypothetical protein
MLHNANGAYFCYECKHLNTKKAPKFGAFRILLAFAFSVHIENAVNALAVVHGGMHHA